MAAQSVNTWNTRNTWRSRSQPEVQLIHVVIAWSQALSRPGKSFELHALRFTSAFFISRPTALDSTDHAPKLLLCPHFYDFRNLHLRLTYFVYHTSHITPNPLLLPFSDPRLSALQRLIANLVSCTFIQPDSASAQSIQVVAQADQLNINASAALQLYGLFITAKTYRNSLLWPTRPTYGNSRSLLLLWTDPLIWNRPWYHIRP